MSDLLLFVVIPALVLGAGWGFFVGLLVGIGKGYRAAREGKTEIWL